MLLTASIDEKNSLTNELDVIKQSMLQIKQKNDQVLLNNLQLLSDIESLKADNISVKLLNDNDKNIKNELEYLVYLIY